MNPLLENCYPTSYSPKDLDSNCELPVCVRHTPYDQTSANDHTSYCEIICFECCAYPWWIIRKKVSNEYHGKQVERGSTGVRNYCPIVFEIVITDLFAFSKSDLQALTSSIGMEHHSVIPYQNWMKNLLPLLISSPTLITVLQGKDKPYSLSRKRMGFLEPLPLFLCLGEWLVLSPAMSVIMYKICEEAILGCPFFTDNTQKNDFKPLNS